MAEAQLDDEQGYMIWSKGCPKALKLVPEEDGWNYRHKGFAPQFNFEPELQSLNQNYKQLQVELGFPFSNEMRAALRASCFDLVQIPLSWLRKLFNHLSEIQCSSHKLMPAIITL